MKAIVLLAFLFTGQVALACKPVALPECDKSDTRLDLKLFGEVHELVKKYQELRDQHLVRPKRVTSCFDNHFATHYLSQISSKLTHSDGLACKGQLNFAKNHVKNLIDQNSQENLGVKNQAKRAELKELAVKIEKAWAKI